MVTFSRPEPEFLRKVNFVIDSVPSRDRTFSATDAGSSIRLLEAYVSILTIEEKSGFETNRKYRRSAYGGVNKKHPLARYIVQVFNSF